MPKIYANTNSIVGSVGVRMGGWAFDYTKYADQFGLERRVKHAGKNKLSFDMFSPERPEDVEKAEQLLGILHEDFKKSVIEVRGNKLAKDQGDLFDGSIWTGGEAVTLGLIDGISDTAQVMEELGVEELKDYSAGGTFIGALKKSLAAEVNLGIKEGIKGAIRELTTDSNDFNFN